MQKIVFFGQTRLPHLGTKSGFPLSFANDFSSFMPEGTSKREHDYYEILRIPKSSRPNVLSTQEVKTAYHRALLTYHPDKAKNNTSLMMKPPGAEHDEPQHSIDEISEAYAILSDSRKRAAYDQERALQLPESSGEPNKKPFHNGVETYDLEDLTFDEAETVWYRGCRCGNEQGYVVTDTELEKESSNGEIYIGCKGCSLWVKVLFGSAVSDAEESLRD